MDVKKAILGAIAATVLIVGAIVLLTGGGRATTPAPALESLSEHPAGHPGQGGRRTLVVKTGAEPPPSRPGSAMHGLLTDGRLPARPTVAMVTSDENCEPDAEGVSHCTNRLTLKGGAKIVVTHPHRMSEVPCMSPGEEVRVVKQS